MKVGRKNIKQKLRNMVYSGKNFLATFEIDVEFFSLKDSGNDFYNSLMFSVIFGNSCSFLTMLFKLSGKPEEKLMTIEERLLEYIPVYSQSN